jgi:site-specific recombinase XerD
VPNEITLELLFQTLTEALNGYSLSERTLNEYRIEGFYPLIRYYRAAGRKMYDRDFNETILQDVQARYEQGQLRTVTRNRIRKVVALMSELYESQTITLETVKRGTKINLDSPYYNGLIESFIQSENVIKERTSRTIHRIARYIRHFFAWLKSEGYATLDDITLKAVKKYLAVAAKQSYKNCMKDVTYALRRLSDFINHLNISSVDFSLALAVAHPERRKLSPTFSPDEVERIFSRVDIATPIGKRDYAVLALAKTLGLRAGDIANLKLADIDWRLNEIRVTQGKTKVELLLPLEPFAGNAVASYILNGRPNTKSEYIFVRVRAPFRKMSSLHYCVNKYLPPEQHGIGYGLHSFRRYVASEMLNAGVPSDTVKNILGHRDINSLKPYARISNTRLKSCPLGLDNIEVQREELI